MIADLLTRKSNGDITSSVSAFQGNKTTRETTAFVTRDYEQGISLMNRGFTEFNHRSVIEEVNANQKSFNTYVPPKSDDPDESWRAQTTKPIVRNKLISIAAHVTASILYPAIFAQNGKNQEDRDSAQVMRDCIEWVIDNSNYSRAFVRGVISALVNPAVVLETEYAQVMRKVKEMQDDGTYTKKEMLDEVMSGFFFHLVPVKELMIANVYEPDIQRQRFIIREKRVDYNESKLVHGHKKNFKYVKSGVFAVFDGATNTFYDCPDDDLEENFVKEVTYYNRALDLQLLFINGIIMCDTEYPLQRADKRYPFAKSGFEPLNDGQFFYYKSAANKLGPDEELVNLLYNYVLDGTFLALMPPMALYGNEELGSSVFVPGSVTSLREDTKLDTVGPRSDLRAGLEAIGLVEKSISESSQDSFRSGNDMGGGDRTAYEISLLEANAKIALGLFGKSIGFLVEDLGVLTIGDILQHLSVPEIKEIANIEDPLRYKSLLLPDKIMEGRKVTKKIQFSDEYMDDDGDISYEEAKKRSFKVLSGEPGGMESETRIYKVNPDIFRSLKYKVKVSVDKLTPQNKALEKALNLEAYDRMIQDPNLDQETVSREFLIEVYRPGEADKFMKKAGATPSPEEAAIGQTRKPSSGTNGNITGQLTGSNSLKNALQQG